MKKLIFFLFFFTSSNLYAFDIKLEKITGGLDKPWSLSFTDHENIIFTEKSGKLYTLNLKSKKIFERFVNKFKLNLEDQEFLELEEILNLPDNLLLDIILKKEKIPANIDNSVMKKILLACDEQ